MPLEDIPFCEVFQPTAIEFENFYGYVEKLSKINKTGIVKVLLFLRLFKEIKCLLILKDYST